MTTEEIAERFRTSPGTVRYWRHIGKGPESFKVGRRVLYDRDVVERWERQAQQGQSSEAAQGWDAEA